MQSDVLKNFGRSMAIVKAFNGLEYKARPRDQ